MKAFCGIHRFRNAERGMMNDEVGPGTRTRQLVYIHPRALLSGGRPRWGWADRYRLFSEEV